MAHGNRGRAVFTACTRALLAMTVVGCRRDEIRTHPGDRGADRARLTMMLDSSEIIRVIEEWGRSYAEAEATQVRSSQTVLADLDSDGQVDLVALYRFGGAGTGYHTRLARFRGEANSYEYLGSTDAGRSGAWILDEMVLVGDELKCRGRVWRENDPNCCPSADTSITLRAEELLVADETPAVDPDEGVIDVREIPTDMRW